MSYIPDPRGKEILHKSITFSSNTDPTFLFPVFCQNAEIRKYTSNATWAFEPYETVVSNLTLTLNEFTQFESMICATPRFTLILTYQC